jgi:hypothetical protein
MKLGLKGSGISWFEKYFAILLFAVHAEPFKVLDVREAVLDEKQAVIRGYLYHLVGLGYLEKINTTTFRATDYAKQLFGATA